MYTCRCRSDEHPASHRIAKAAAMLPKWATHPAWRSTLRCLRAFTEEEKSAADFHTVAAFERVTTVHRLTVDQYLPAPGGADEEILAFVTDYRMLREHSLVAKESYVAFLGASD